MRCVVAISLWGLAAPLLAQDLQIPDNPYDAASESVRRSNAFKRERWFYEQRMYPFNTIPKDAYENALAERDRLRGARGFFLGNSAAWTSIGPTCGYYFSYGNISSRIATIKFDPNNPSIIYLGAAFGGVWKSTNGGTTWLAKSDNEVSLSSGALAIDPANSNNVYYGTGEATYSAASYYGRGLLKSTNGGDTWVNYTSGLASTTYFSRLVIRPNHSSELLAALGSSSGGLYRSTNAGQSWFVVVSGRCDDVVFSPTGDTVYAVGSGTGYKISTNGGQSFSSSASLTMRTRNQIAICRTSPNILYASTYGTTGSTIMVFRSTDAGSTFNQVSAGTDFNGGQAWYDFYVHVNPFDPNYVYVGAIDIWRSTNGGTSFQNITNGYAGGNVHVDQHNMDFHPTDSQKMYCVNDGGVWYSTNRGGTWANLNWTLTLTQFYRIASDPTNAAHILGGTQDNGTQRTTGSINWTAAFGGDGGEVCFQSQNALNILGETQNNGVYRSIDGGVSWSSSTTGLSGSGAWVGPLISHPDSVNIFYTARDLVFKSTNGGASWLSISSGTSGTIREMAISKSSPNVMFATSGSQIYKSTNGGATWSLTSSGMPNRTITSIYVHPDSPNVVLVTFSGFGAGKIYRSTNGGTSWANISGNLPDTPVNDVFIYHPGVSTNTYLAATDVGVFVSNDFGASWSELADGLPNTVAIHLDYNQPANKIRIGTHGRGVYETMLPTPALTMVVPNGGEDWPAGTVQSIRWNSSLLAENVKIELSRNGGGSYSTLFSNVPNDGTEPWTVTGPSTSNARIRVSSISSPALSDVSNAAFTIRTVMFALLTKLEVRDNGGESDSLQWGTGAGATDGIDPLFGEIEQPPVPPVGVFDVRWQIAGTEGTKRDTRDTLGGTHQQAIYTGRLQAGEGGYPFVLWWNRSELPSGSFTLRDGSGGTVFTVDMKQQDSLVIANDGIDLFEIVYDANNGVTSSVQGGWNMVSLPVSVGDRRKAVVFPTSISGAFAYTPTGYAGRDTLEYGTGYWLKFPTSQSVSLTGGTITTDTVFVAQGWNMIGSISTETPVGNIVQVPSGIVVSQYFGFSGGSYVPSPSITPMKSYWVKANQNGRLVLYQGASKGAKQKSGE